MTRCDCSRLASDGKQIVTARASVPKSVRTPTRPDAPASISVARPGRPPESPDVARVARLAKLIPAGGREWMSYRNVHYLLIPLAVLCVFAVLFVIGDVVERRVFPERSTALHHFLLTLRAGLATLVASGVVFHIMHRQNQALSRTAKRLTQMLESYQSDPAHPERFENPHLVHCRKLLKCRRTQCPMYDSPVERCWQVVALSSSGAQSASALDIQRCLECKVYRTSCPDALTELGESFNNLMFLLEQEAKQVGRMRAQMVEKEKMVAIGQMATGIAHEVGNPLSSISSIVQMLKRSGSNRQTTEQLDLIETHIQRISGTVRQLVSLARPGVDRWEMVDVGKTLEDVVRLVRFDRRARNAQIVLEAPDNLPRTYGLRDQLQQVFINLSLNALDAMANGGRLTIRAEKRRRDIVVSVRDTGCGISREVGRRVFEPFFTTKQPGQGSGLGLSVSYGITQRHGGTIDFESVADQGTAFTVQLPILDKSPEM